MPGTSTYDALVIGAGPAGSAAAWALAREGMSVAILEQHAFPRDKVCGDALIADALGALDTMGVREAVACGSVHAGELRIHAPDGRAVSLRGEFRCLPRTRLDALLVEAARAAGATLIERTTALGPREEDGRVTGVKCRQGREPVEIAARHTVLATGANATALQAFGFRARLKPNAIAGRAYYRVSDDAARRHPHLSIAYDRPSCPGYGWIFPGTANCYNIGVGLFSRGADDGRGLHELWTRFTTTFGPAAALLREATLLTDFKGAPMRTAMLAGPYGRRGLLVVGEAASTTYPATGEGIGKAMETGLLAAEIIADAFRCGHGSADLSGRYQTAFRRWFEPRYRAYRQAEAWASRPWMLNLLARRANAGRFVRAELETLVAERGDPAVLFSARGLLTALVR